MTAVLQLLVLAKAPVPGRVKTRLCPPYRQEEAALLAAASLADVLDAVRATPADRRVLVLDGDPALVDHRGFEVLAQVPGALDVRLAAAFAAVASGPALLVGMDTPQLRPDLLAAAGETLRRHDACLGPAYDGGWWALGLRRPDPALVRGIRCSLPTTGRQQRNRLRAAGLSVAALPPLRDVDTADDLPPVVRLAPDGRFGRVYRQLAAVASDRSLRAAQPISTTTLTCSSLGRIARS